MIERMKGIKKEQNNEGKGRSVPPPHETLHGVKLLQGLRSQSIARVQERTEKSAVRRGRDVRHGCSLQEIV